AARYILEHAGTPAPAFVAAARRLLADAAADPAFAAEALALPAEAFLAEQMGVVDPDALHAARNALKLALARELKADWLAVYRANASSGAYSPDAASAGRRALRNLAMSYLVELETTDVLDLCQEQYRQ